MDQFSIREWFVMALAMCVLCTAGGCASMTPGKMAWVRPDSDRARAGNVYLLRGWIGIFSTGINHLGEKLNAAGVRSSVYQEDQWRGLAAAIKEKYGSAKEHEPLILVGHSFGADDALRVSRELGEAGIMVDLVITLDPVTPPEVPGNVRRCYNLYESNGAWDKVPAFRGVPLKLADGSRSMLQNVDVRKDRTDLLEPGTDHFNIEKKAKIHAEVLRQVLATCPTRSEWVAAHGGGQGPIYASQAAGKTAGRPAGSRVDQLVDGGSAVAVRHPTHRPEGGR
jgi:pimeloyl-ACP methyl ester carboxylesterase